MGNDDMAMAAPGKGGNHGWAGNGCVTASASTAPNTIRAAHGVYSRSKRLFASGPTRLLREYTPCAALDVAETVTHPHDQQRHRLARRIPNHTASRPSARLPSRLNIA